jgi:hypothetical protein
LARIEILDNDLDQWARKEKERPSDRRVDKIFGGHTKIAPFKKDAAHE